ncbi:MAG: UDP-N-acetylmuramoyl-L-alanyl-D-glutamate--2,6-diaminopimelate ligase [Lachnospiraceae bacterium]|nr:UDP-N-acetylmuramoyl-L-alanyl-D-glutamate--2,6-diaminopimelate ligase [Lachnospiraceae bacterium]
MKLEYLLEKVEYTVIKNGVNIEINKLEYDSRKVEKGDVFICIKGAASDGHKYIPQVIEKGAAAVVVCDDVEVTGEITVIKTNDTRLALACMSAAFFGYPAEKITTIGITGTKGKTTTSYMVKSVLENVGIKTGLIGTIETIIDKERIPSVNSTPESYLVQKYFAKMVEAGCKCVVMEVSSQGLMQHRVGGFEFDYGIFTNLSADHIGPSEHKDFEDYLKCKSMLMKQCKHAIVNRDDKYVDEILKGNKCQSVEGYGIEKDCELKATNIKLFTKPGLLCVSYDVTGVESFPIEIHMPGKFNVYNSLCALAICRHFTEDEKRIKDALLNVSVKGRVEIIKVSERFTMMIDYAHNAMSLESLLETIREYNPKRIVTLFGCGGNRSKDRRFEMGEVSSRLSDFTIVTSDNPRFEEPNDIIGDIVTGVKRAYGEFVTVPDRKDAIRYAIMNAKDGDVIILAGKGHEDYQEIKGVKYPLDERILIKEIISEEEVKKVL